ncbi:MAG: hypothetical protein ACYTGV_02390 [Planctomycetota bacterium]
MKPEILPPRLLPTVYFGAGHLALALALLLVALEPERVAGFFLHARMLMVVHLITLGWITTSVLGATYIVGPIALRMPMPARVLDWIICVGTLLGAAGVVAHFWLDSYAGVAWSGGLLGGVFLLMAGRVLRALKGARAPGAVRLHIGLAYGNIVLAALLGTLLAMQNKSRPLTEVYGHAHVAALGWAIMMVVGVGYRLLPMFLPAAPPAGPLPWASAILLELGVLGFVLSFFTDGLPTVIFALSFAAGITAFMINGVRMLFRRLPAPKKLRTPDIGLLHTGQALVYLLLTVAVGLFLAHSKQPRPDWFMVYGVFGLLGFLGQIILGIGMRLFPMFAFTEAWAGGGFVSLPPNPHEMPVRPLQYAALALWSAGVPLLAYGLFRDMHGIVSTAAWLLFAGTLAAGFNAARVVAIAFHRPSGNDTRKSARPFP